ncbi:MAG: hypothetical protein AAB919_00660 [Patescibacteria group bacterium]
MHSDDKYNTYFPDSQTAIIIPRNKDRATVTRVERAEPGKPGLVSPPVPVARSAAEEMAVLAPYQPSEQELELVRWVKANFEAVTAAEVHGIIYRSMMYFYITPVKDEILIRAKATELGVGLPGRK